MKKLRYVIAITSWIFLAGCDMRSTSSATGADPAPARDSIGILDYTTSGEMDKAIPATEDVISGSITIAVDESLQPIIEAEINTFEFLYEDATIHAIYLPGEEAIAAMLSSDSVRMAISTRELRPEEEALLRKRSISAKYAHLFSDGVAVLAHPDYPQQQLTHDELRQLLTGEITSWVDLGEGTSDAEVSLVVDNRASSILSTLKNTYLEGQQPTTDRLFALTSTREVIDYVAEHPGSLGFIGAAWISDRDDKEMAEYRKKVTFVALEKSKEDSLCLDAKPYFLPYQSYLYQGCYPLTRKVTSVLRESTLGLGTGFVSFMDSPKGQLVIHKSGLATVHAIGRKVKLPAKIDLVPDSINSNSE